MLMKDESQVTIDFESARKKSSLALGLTVLLKNSGAFAFLADGCTTFRAFRKVGFHGSVRQGVLLLRLILGGAAIHRCDIQSLFNDGFSR